MSPNSPDSPEPVPASLVGPLIRRADADDAAMIFSYWLRDYYERSAFAKGITKSTFMRLHHHLLEHVIARSTVWVACDMVDPSVIFGFICTEGDILHYIYVKRRFRRFGVAGLLFNAAGMPEGPKIFTHLTDEMISLRKRWPLAEYVPYAV